MSAWSSEAPSPCATLALNWGFPSRRDQLPSTRFCRRAAPGSVLARSSRAPTAPRFTLFFFMMAPWVARWRRRGGALEREDAVALDHPARELGHRPLLRALEVRLVLVDPAPRHAGAADLHRHPLGDQILEHLDEILVVRIRLLQDVAGHVDGVVHEEDPHVLSALAELARQAEAVPGDVGAVVGLVVEDDEDAHVRTPVDRFVAPREPGRGVVCYSIDFLRSPGPREGGP